MNLNEWVQERWGRSKELAQHLQVAEPVVSNWVTGKKEVPAVRAVAIEKYTGAEVTRQELRPNDWHQIWPELAQRQAA